MTAEEYARSIGLVYIDPATDQPSGGGMPQSSNPVLAGNDALRQQFADHPELAPPNSAQWLDQREQHLLGNDAPPIITAIAPPAQPAPPPQMPATAPNPPVQSLPPPAAPQAPPMLPQAAAAPPLPPSPPMSAPQLSQQAQITPFQQQAPVMSQVSPAPKAPASAQINNDVTMPQQTFNQAYQPPPLPTLLNPSLLQNNPYKPAPSMPGYAMPRPGSPFMGQHPAATAPTLSDVNNPFLSPGFAGGGFTAGGPSASAGIAMQQPYDNSLFNTLLMPRIAPQF